MLNKAFASVCQDYKNINIFLITHFDVSAAEKKYFLNKASLYKETETEAVILNSCLQNRGVVRASSIHSTLSKHITSVSQE